MATNANALATFAEAMARFGYLETEQTKVEGLINLASAKIELFTKRALAARSTTLYFDGTGKDSLFVTEWPINSVTTLHIDEARAFGASTLIASTDYYIDAEEGIITLYDDVFSSLGEKNVVKLVANLGYATTHLQYPVLNGACLEYVDWLKSRYSNPGTIGKKGEYSIDRVSVSYELSMPGNVRDFLEDFVRRSA